MSMDTFTKSLSGWLKGTISREFLEPYHGRIPIVLFCFEFFFLSFEYVEPRDGAYGAFVNASWNGLVGMLIQGVSESL